MTRRLAWAVAAAYLCLVAASRIGAQPLPEAVEAPPPLSAAPADLADLMRRQAMSDAIDFAGPWWPADDGLPWREQLLVRAAKYRHASDYLLAVERAAQRMEAAP